jgi:uncharacterized protein YeaO (DUF488 family)
MKVKIKRVYEPFEKSDGYRILIDGLWPRGIKKENAQFDKWMKGIAPSTELRKWFNHEPGKWKQFCEKYLIEIKNSSALNELSAEVDKHKTVTLLYAAKDEHFNNAVFIQRLLLQDTNK